MMKRTAKKAKSAAFAFFCAMPIALVSFAVAFGPSPSDRGSSAEYDSFLVPSFLAGFGLAWTLFAFALSVRPFKRYAAAAGVVVLSSAVCMFIAGVAIHRDFFTAVFQYVMLTPAVALYGMLVDADSELSGRVVRQAARGGYVAAAFYLQWVMLMGYAIATRGEPRPVESLTYNVYNLVLVFVVFFLSRVLEGRRCRRVTISPHYVLIDGKDVAPMLGSKKVRILWAFVSAGERSLRCSEIQGLEAGPLDGRHASCGQCGESSVKAASCRGYRNTYNSLQEIKKVLEFFEIGTIIPPGNKRQVLSVGWKLSFFDTVRLRARK